MDTASSPVIMRKGPLLVVTTGAILPGRCVKCNGPEAIRKRLKLRWHAPWLSVLLLLMCVIGPFGLLLYAIVSAAMSKRVIVEAGLCARHRKIHRIHKMIGSLLCLGGVGVIVAAIMWQQWDAAVWILSGLGLLFAGLIYLNVATPILRVTKIERSVAYARGCPASYLAELGWSRLCVHCGYDMRGHRGADPTEAAICPECGTPV